MRAIVVFLLALLSFWQSPADARHRDITVIRGHRSPYLDQVYYAFAASSDKPFINFDYKPGREAAIARSIKAEGGRVVLIVGKSSGEMLAALDKKLSVLVLLHGDIPPEEQQDEVVQISTEIAAPQMLAVLRDIFPKQRRIGIAYNPKLTQKKIDRYVRAQTEQQTQLALLKVDQPSDIGSLMPTFHDKIDIFLLVKDATVIKAGIEAIVPFLQKDRLPLVSSTDAFTGRGSFLTVVVEPLSLGRIAWNVVKRMLAGQTTFSQSFEKKDITLNFSLKEATKLKYDPETVLTILSNATTAGYQVHLLH